MPHLLLILLLSCVPVFGGYFSVSWDSEDGLPHNAVYGIVQSPDGYVWLATYCGLARFDGFQFRRVDAAILAHRQGDSIRQLTLGVDGSVLAAPNQGGLARASKDGVSPHPANDQIEGERIASLYAASDGTLWLSFYGGILYHWKDGSLIRVGKIHGSGSGRVTMAEYGGELWLAVGDFLGVWEDGAFQRREVSARFSYQVTASKDGIWVAGEDGLSKMRGRVELERIPWSESMSSVRTMLETTDGSLWLGTVDSGLWRWDGQDLVQGPATHP